MKRRSFLSGVLGAVAWMLSGASAALRAAVADVSSKIKACAPVLRLLPVPKWNHRNDDIDFGDFQRRFTDSERTLLPQGMIFPHPGQIWEAVRDCEASVRPESKHPLLWRNHAISKGERVRILPLDGPKPLQVNFCLLGEETSVDCPGSDSSTGQLSMRTACTVPLPGYKQFYFSDSFRLVESQS